MKKKFTKSIRTIYRKFKAWVYGIAFLIVVIFGVLMCFIPVKDEPKSILPAILYIPETQVESDVNQSEDALGDFILQHEYFAADQEVLDHEEVEKSYAPIETFATEEESFSLISDDGEEKSIIEHNPDGQTEGKVSELSPKRIILQKIDNATPLIAVVIDDMGINHKRTKDIIGLKAPLTASFLTYGSHLAEFASLSSASGHEIMIHAPMEPKIKANLAPDTLLVEMDQMQIEAMFDSMLEKFADLPVRGINNHMGSRFTEDKEKLAFVMQILKDRQMFFLDSKTTSSSKGKELAEEDGVDYIGRDVFLDNENDYDYIMAQLKKTEKIAAKKGFAVAICHPKSQTYRALKDWLQTLKDKPVKLVHVSEIVRAVNQPIQK